MNYKSEICRSNHLKQKSMKKLLSRQSALSDLKKVISILKKQVTSAWILTAQYKDLLNVLTLTTWIALCIYSGGLFLREALSTGFIISLLLMLKSLADRLPSTDNDPN